MLVFGNRRESSSLVISTRFFGSKIVLIQLLCTLSQKSIFGVINWIF